jgi:UDP-N-acetylmuramoyl-tripeptide--D-alanyl-D-alanine ligase
VGGTVVQVVLPGLGVHLAHNALAALAVAWAAGVDLHAAAAALQRYAPVGQRMLPSRIGPWLVLEDCYNANPRSTETALDTLATLPRPHVAVLGSMLELGPTEHDLHARVGAHAARTEVDLLVAVGDFAADYAHGARQAGLTAVTTPADADRAARAVADVAHSGGTVLVKGSRGARMERVVAALASLANKVTPPTGRL